MADQVTSAAEMADVEVAENLTPTPSFFIKELANILSTFRIIGAVVLFFFSSLSLPFLIIYFVCGMTDLFDGPITRRFHTQSSLGNVLDTIGDVLMYLALAKVILMEKLVALWVYIWMAIALIGHLASAFIAQRKFGTFYFLHSEISKLMGASVFLVPLFLAPAIDLLSNLYLGLMCVIVTMGAVECITIMLSSKELRPQINSFQKLYRAKKEEKRLK